METILQKKYEVRANIIKAIAHPSRLFIVEELKKNKRSSGELTNLIGCDASTVSKHLSILKNAGLVFTQREKTTIYYHLKCPCILDFIGCIEEVLKINNEEETEILYACKVK